MEWIPLSAIPEGKPFLTLKDAGMIILVLGSVEAEIRLILLRAPLPSGKTAAKHIQEF